MLVKILFLFIMSVFKCIHLGYSTDVYIYSATCFNAETVEEKRQLQIKRSSPSFPFKNCITVIIMKKNSSKCRFHINKVTNGHRNTCYYLSGQTEFS